MILLREASDDALFIFLFFYFLFFIFYFLFFIFYFSFVNSLIEVLAALVLDDVSTQCPRRKCDGSSTNEKKRKSRKKRKKKKKKNSQGGKGNERNHKVEEVR